MKPMPCPICGEPIPSMPTQFCPMCQAILGGEFTAQFNAAIRADDRDGEGPLAGVGEVGALEDDELLRTFQAQFERHQVELPREWVLRLHRLATETEPSRRVATVFFVDLRGYTRLSRTFPEEKIDRLLQWFFGVCSRRVELHGGFVIQFLGDGVLAAFGAPWAFERDAESALRTLLEIREEVRARDEFEGCPLQIRAGADSGTVGVRFREIQGQHRLDIFGSTVNLAARLEQHAETWDILITDRLAEHVRGIFDLESRPPFTPSNYDEQVQPWAVKALREVTADRRGQATRLVGRGQEMDRLRRWIDEAASGKFIAACIEGETGVGKTRLVAEALERYANEKTLILAADCEPHTRYVLLGPMLSMIRQIMTWAAPEHASLQSPTEADLSAISAKLPGLDPLVFPSLGFVLGVEPHLSRLRTIPPATLREQVVAALAALFHTLSDAAPLVIFVDDVHWCDRLSWEVLEKLIALRPKSCMVLVARRSEADLMAHVSIPEFGQDWERLSLGPLDEPELRELVEQVLDLRKLHPLVLRRLLEEFEGIPLYLLEVARELAGRDPASWMDMIAPPADVELTERVPRAVVEVLQSRLDAMDGQRRALLRRASVLGRRFSLRMITLFETIQEETLAELYALKGLRMLREEQLADDVAFVFTPTLLRELTYHTMTSAQRESLHAEIAERIETHYAGRDDAFIVDLALHWIRAGRLDRARPYLRRAAQRVMANGAPEEAYELARRALDHPGNPDLSEPLREGDGSLLGFQQRGLLEELAGEACRLLGDFDRAQVHFEAMERISIRIGHDAWRARALHQSAIIAVERGNPSRSIELAAEAARLGASNPDLLRRLEIASGIARLRTGRLDEALTDFLVAATQVAPAAAAPVHGDGWNNAGLVYWQKGDLKGAQSAFSAALEVWDRLGNVYGRLQTLSNLGIIAEKQGNWTQARTLYDRASALAEKIGNLHGISAIEANRANLMLLMQRWTEAQSHAARALDVARMIGHRHSEAVALENLGLALGGLGLVDEALSTLDQARAVAEAAGDPTRRDSALLASAWVALQSDQPQIARSMLERLQGELSPDLLAWRETLVLSLSTIDENIDAGQELTLSLEGLRGSGTTEDYVRRLDAVILLDRRGLLEPPDSDWITLRARLFAPDGPHAT